MDARVAGVMGRCARHTSRRGQAGVSEARVEGADISSALHIFSFTGRKKTYYYSTYVYIL